MEMLAERASVTKTTLYLRHKDKIALLRATLNDRMRDWSTRSSQDDWMLGDTLEERLVFYAATALKWAPNEEVMATRRLVRGSLGEAGQIAREMDKTIRAPMLQQLATEITKYAEIEGFPVRNPHNIARMFMGMLESLVDRDAEEWLSAAEQLEVAKMAVAILIRGRSAW